VVRNYLSKRARWGGRGKCTYLMPQFPLFGVHVLLVLQVLREKPSILFPLLVYRFLARAVSGWPITLQQ
jgi:hypothetical protein